MLAAAADRATCTAACPVAAIRFGRGLRGPVGGDPRHHLGEGGFAEDFACDFTYDFAEDYSEDCACDFAEDYDYDYPEDYGYA